MISNIYQNPFPTLDLDDQYILREQSLEDTEAFFKYYTDPDVCQHILATTPKTMSAASDEIHYCRNLFYAKSGLYWTIARKDNKQMIGAIGLYMNNHHHRAEICYDLAKPYWRKGIMVKAIKKVMDFAFREIGVFRIEALTLKENIPSIAVLQKLGFIQEGSLNNYRYFKGKTYSVELLAVTPALLKAHHEKEKRQVAEIIS